MISVIVPVYKVEEYIDRCVQSIVSQTYRDIEILLVDDGSPDRCGAMCDEWAAKDSRIRVFHKTNGGLSDARNYALDRMRGDFVAFVDSDDWLEPECFEYQLKVLESEPQAGMAAFGYRAIRRGEVHEMNPCADAVLSREEALQAVLYEHGMFVCACAKLYRRYVFEGLRYKIDALFEDEELIGEILLRCEKIVSGSRTHYNYLQREGSIVHQAFTRKKYDDQMAAMDHLCSVARRFDRRLAAGIRRREARDRMSLLRLMSGCAKEFEPLCAQLRCETLRRWRILFDGDSCWRDKLGLLALVPGFWCFALLWSFYERIRRN